MATTAQHDPLDSALARSAASGVRWTSLGGAVAVGLSVVQTLVVARLLSPTDYGLMASAMVVIGIGAAFSDAGLASAIVARKTTPETLSSLYWLNLAMGAVVCAAVVAAAPLVSAFYDEPRLEAITRVAALTFLIGPIGQQFDWLLHKALRFRPLGLVQITASVVGTAVAITAAALGAGVYALILAMLVTASVNSAVLVAIAWREWRPMLRFRWADIQRYLDFGLYQMGERSVNYAAANMDYILVGRFLGPSALGTYSIAYQLVIKPLIYINPMLNRVAFPVFASRQGDNRTLRSGYLQIVRLIAYVTFPLMLGLAVLAPEFVRVVLGAKWEASVPVLQVLCAVGALKSIGNPVGAVLLAKDRADVGFKGNLIALGAMLGALLVAVHHGLMAVAWTYLGVTVLGYVAWLLVMHRLVSLSLGEYVRTLKAPLGFSLVMAASMALLHMLLSETVAAPVVILLGVATFGGLVYAALLVRFEATYLRGLWRLFRSRAPVARTG